MLPYQEIAAQQKKADILKCPPFLYYLTRPEIS